MSRTVAVVGILANLYNSSSATLHIDDKLNIKWPFFPLYDLPDANFTMQHRLDCHFQICRILHILKKITLTVAIFYYSDIYKHANMVNHFSS